MHAIGQRGPRPEGPLVPYMDAFKRRSISLGYAPTTVRMHAPLISGFSKWLGQKKIAIENISSDHTKRYLRYRARHRCPRSDAVATLRRLLDLLREEGIIAEQRACRNATPVQRLLDEYACYLQQERGLSPRTLIYYLDFARSFLVNNFGAGSPEISTLSVADVIKFVQRQAASGSRGVAKKLTTALRSFLRYARYRGYTALDLATGVPAVANWSMPSIPRSIRQDHVRRVLAHCNRRTAIGSRDYAILLLLARLGLRASAIAFLELDDIDWEAATLSVRGKDLKLDDVDLRNSILTIHGAKYGKSRLVPIHPSTQKVLVNYLRRRKRFLAGRDSPHLFVSRTGNRLDTGDVHRTFYFLSRQIGLRAPSASHGPRLHDFRHRFAVQTLLRWYRSGLEVEPRLPVLSTYLGHVRVSDTYWYLSACPELMGQAVNRLEQRWEGAR